MKKKNLSKQSVSPRPYNSNRGSVLLIASWALCLLATFVLILNYAVRQKIILVQHLDERDKLCFISEAGVERAIFEITRSDEEQPDALNSSWSNNPGIFKDIKTGDGEFSVFYDYRDESTGALVKKYGIIDEESKININKVDQVVLRNLFKQVTALGKTKIQNLAAAIVDWCDKDSELSTPLGSAEDSYYRSLSSSYEAKDGPFEVLEELLLVKDMDEDILRSIEGYITVYGLGSINANTASGPVLSALGLSGDIVDKILLFRKGEDGVAGTPDDNIFEASGTIVSQLSQFCNLSEAEVVRLTAVADEKLVTKSSNFRIKSKGVLTKKGREAEIVCVVDRTGDILYWGQ